MQALAAECGASASASAAAMWRAVRCPAMRSSIQKAAPSANGAGASRPRSRHQEALRLDEPGPLLQQPAALAHRLARDPHAPSRR